MFSRLERTIAFRYLRPNRSDRFVSVITGFSFLGILLGVATLIVVMAVMNGFRQELFHKILGMNAHIAVYGQVDGRTAPLGDYMALQKSIAALPGVLAATPVVEGQVLISQQGKSFGALVRGLEPKDLMAKELLAKSIVAGALDQVDGNDAAMIGSRLAKRLGVGVGDRITLVSPNGQTTPFGTVPAIRAYTVRAIYEIGMFEYDSNFVFLPLRAAQVYFNLEKQVSGIEITTADPFTLLPLKRQLFLLLPDNADMTDWQRAHAGFFNAIQIERNVMFLILTLIIIVAAFNIISGLVMLVKDKSTSIAILRGMGASQGMIMRIFILAGSAVGIMGTLCGVILGVLLADNIESVRQFFEFLSGANLFNAEIYFLSTLPAQIDWSEVWSVVLMALSLSLLATLYPSWRAARLDPVQALRYE
jgi:lipoprotein-releasing system permease protein